MDAREIERCIDEFGTDIYRFCLKLCMDQTDAEDLYQQTFLKALETTWTLDWEQNPRALFFSLAHNLWRSDRRKMARRNRIAPCGHLNEKVQETLRLEENMEENLFQKELIAEVDRMIQELPEKIRVPLILFYLSDCSIEQIAAIIKKPPGTVKSRLFKGRNLIKKDWRILAMKDNRFDPQTDRAIRDSMKLKDEPSRELNDKLKEAVYRKEKALQKQPAIYRLSFWYLPMIFNLVTFGALAIIALMAVNNVYLSYMIAGICIYIGISGVLLTAVGVKRANFKEELAIHVEKRGALA